MKEKQIIEHNKLKCHKKENIREKVNDLENRIIKIETIFKTIGIILKWTGIVIGIISGLVTIAIKLGWIKV